MFWAHKKFFRTSIAFLSGGSKQTPDFATDHSTGGLSSPQNDRQTKQDHGAQNEMPQDSTEKVLFLPELSSLFLSPSNVSTTMTKDKDVSCPSHKWSCATLIYDPALSHLAQSLWLSHASAIGESEPHPQQHSTNNITRHLHTGSFNDSHGLEWSQKYWRCSPQLWEEKQHTRTLSLPWQSTR